MKRALLVLSSAVLMMAFTPPLPVQQQPPKTWIPEPRPHDPIIAAPDPSQPPAAPAVMSHAPPGLACEIGPGTMHKAKKEFVEAYQQAALALREGRYADVVRHAGEAAPFALDGQQWSVLEQMRVAAFEGLGDAASEVAAINAALAGSCLAPAIQKNYEQMLPALREKP